MRPNRIYAIDEMLNYDDRAQLSDQRASLDAMGIRFGRWLRITVVGVADAWLLLVRDSDDFTSSAVTTLSAIGPYLAAALRTLSALIEQRLQTALAQAALTRIGVAQLAFDAEGRVMAADADAEQLLSFVHGPEGRINRRLMVLPEVAAALDSACAALARGQHGDSRIVQIDPQMGLNLLLRKSNLEIARPSALPAVLGVLRCAKREEERVGAEVLRQIFGLSDREAALAEALSRGKSIIEAGRELRLTDETARNYSKRIYAKTGARGQGDLVRLVLTGLAPFA
jgi:DNA-binding CsgD family transcriptional regulator